MFRTLFQHRQIFIRIVLLFLLTALLTILTPILMGYAIHQGIIRANVSVLYDLVILLLMISVSLSLLNIVKSRLFRRFQTQIIFQLQSQLMERLFQLPLAFFDRFTIGELTQRALVIEPLSQIISEEQLGSYLFFLSSFISFGMMMYFDWQLTCFTLIIIVLLLGLSTWSALQILPHLKKYVEKMGETHGFLFQIMNGIYRIKSFNKESTVATLGAEQHHQARHALSRAHQLGIWRLTLFKSIPLFMTILLFAAILSRSTTPLSFEKLIIFFSAYMQFIVGFIVFSLKANALVPSLITYQHLQPILETAIDNETQSKEVSYSSDISIKHLYFQYPSAKAPVLHDIHCTIPFEKHTAFVGLSGSGKSTLFKLLLGLYRPQQGEIFIGHDNLKEIDLSSFRKQVGIVLQESKLINGSILENIMGIDENEEEAWRVADLVGLGSLIRSLPMKMHTLLSQQINLISGGQKQLLLIAKALVGNPRLLLLDEATNALDLASQDLVVQCIRQLKITTISIAHRLSTVQQADKIMVLHHGKIIETGTYQQLIQQPDSFFYQLAKQQ